MADANIRAIITAEDRASATLKKVGDNIDDFGGKAKAFLGDAVGQATAIAAAGFAALGAAVYASTTAFMESQNVQAQLGAVLASTHGKAGLYLEDLNDQAKALQKLTKFSDEQIGSAQALLLTFTDLSGATVQQATGTVLDMSQALGEDLKSASIQVGKALQDPILGITALRRVGVNFSEAQKQVIQDLVDTGQKAKAQQLILKELNTEFGGSAKAAGQTFSGQLIILQNQLNDVQEKIGEVILNALQPFLQKVIKVVEALDWDAIVSKTVKTLVNFKNEFIAFTKPIANFIQDHRQLLIDLFTRWGASMAIIIPTLAAVGVAVAVLTNPLVIIASVLAGLWYMWDKHRLILLELTAVLSPLILALGVLKVQLMFTEAVAALNTAFAFFTGTEIAATLATQGFAAAALAAWAAVAAPLIITIVGVAAIWAAYEALQALTDAWNKAAAASAQSDAMDNNAIKAIRANPNLSQAEKSKRIQGLLDPGYRAAGGPVAAGMPYIVGESGQELFVPSQNGTIVPNSQIGGKGGQTTVNINANIGMYMGSERDKREIARQLFDAIKDVAGAKNMTVAEMLT